MTVHDNHGFLDFKQVNGKTKAESKGPNFTALADSQTLRASLREVCEY